MLGQVNLLLLDIVMNGITGVSFKDSGQIAAVHMYLVCDGNNRQVFAEMVRDILFYLLDGCGGGGA